MDDSTMPLDASFHVLSLAAQSEERGRLAVELNHINDDLMAEVVGLHADLARLHAVISKARADLYTEHVIDIVGPGCVVCSPQDGKWPCIARMVGDDLWDAEFAAESRALPEGDEPCGWCRKPPADQLECTDIPCGLVESRALPEGNEA